MKKVFLLTVLALIAFAANSVLARLALTGGGIGPGSFTAVRFISGAVVLAILTVSKSGGASKLLNAGNWRSAGALFLYGAFTKLSSIRAAGTFF